jgi:hypothetical protein
MLAALLTPEAMAGDYGLGWAAGIVKSQKLLASRFVGPAIVKT